MLDKSLKYKVQDALQVVTVVHTNTLGVPAAGPPSLQLTTIS